MKHFFQYLIVAACTLAPFKTIAQQQAFRVRGTVTDSRTGRPVDGANLRIKGNDASFLTDTAGRFDFPCPQTSAVLVISHMGYASREVVLALPLAQPSGISLAPDPYQLEEVTISTGYQTVPKERATGSFERVGERLFNRAVTTGVLERLDGVTTGTWFDRRSYDHNARGQAQLTIRGVSTLRSAHADPLIILDNFPYEGDPALINPNDVESVTLLKDAAAASIWGARAGNGVIVITSKKGSFNRPAQIRFNSAVTVAGKPDLMVISNAGTSDFIDVEQFLFAQGYYNATINSRFMLPLSPVTDLLLQVRSGVMDSLAAQQQIDQWRHRDVRKDFLDHTYRNAFNQQYAGNISGGSAKYTYMLSGGYDRNLESLVSNRFNRTTLRTHHRLKITDRLEAEAALRYAHENSTRPLPGGAVGYGMLSVRGRTLYPYAALIDGEGNHLAIPRDYRTSYTDTAGGGLLLDWAFRPLDEMHQNTQDRQQEVRADLNLSYRLFPFLTAGVSYMHQLDAGESRQHYPESGYYARDLVNQYTQVVGGRAVRILPVGGMLRQSHNRADGYGLRGQLQANQRWQDRHHVVALVGMEARQHRTWNNQHAPRYGYDDQTLTYIHNIDFNTRHPIYDGLKANTAISNAGSLSQLTNRFVSLYGNASYTFDERYVVSGSFRRDASNVFGVRQNEKWSPLWSSGLSWLLSSEPWYAFGAMPLVKLRATYGYSGNVDPSVAAQTILTHVSGHPTTGLPFASAWTGPNPNLRWEKVRTINFGVDLASRGSRISGSVEYYLKHTHDLLATAPLDPTIGFGLTAIRNAARTRGRGVDLQLNTRNLAGPVLWSSHLLASYHKTTVRDYYLPAPNSLIYVGSGMGVNPIVGQVISPIYSYAWHGLDPVNGDPIGMLAGEASKDYYNIHANTPLEELVFHGSATPLYFGALRNEFQYRNVALSVNVSWFFDYYFRRPSLNYSAFYDSWRSHGEFSQRWQQPGDEQRTNVPSMPYPANGSRDAVYQHASINVLRGDHIRLQDVRLGYRLRQVEIHGFASNLGILWRRNGEKLDPRTLGQPGPPRSLSLGFTLNIQ